MDNPPIQSLYVYHSNPAAVTPDQNQVLRGLAREDLFTVVHERFMTDTARYADVLLPSTSSLEHSDLYRSYGTYCMQRAKPAIPPVGESKSNWEVFGLLAEAMGFSEPVFRRGADELIDHLLSIPNPLREEIDHELLLRAKLWSSASRRMRPPNSKPLLKKLRSSIPKSAIPCPVTFPLTGATFPFA